MKSDGTSPKQSTGFNFRDNGTVEKGSLDRVVVLHGPTREAKRKLSPPFLLDKAQIASVVQSLRSEGQKQAHSSPTLNLNNGDTNYISTWPKSTKNTQRLSAVKGKKGAARNKFSFREHNSAVGGQLLNCTMSSQPSRSAELVESDGQRRSSEAGTSEVVRFTASTGSVVVNQGWESGKPESIQEVVQLQKQEGVEGIGEGREVAIPRSGLGSSCAMQCEAIGRLDSTNEFGGVADRFCHDDVQVNHNFGGVLPTSDGFQPAIILPRIGDGGFAAHDSSISRERPDRMVLEGGGEIE